MPYFWLHCCNSSWDHEITSWYTCIVTHTCSITFREVTESGVGTLTAWGPSVNILTESIWTKTVPIIGPELGHVARFYSTVGDLVSPSGLTGLKVDGSLLIPHGMSYSLLNVPYYLFQISFSDVLQTKNPIALTTHTYYSFFVTPEWKLNEKDETMSWLGLFLLSFREKDC